jgi:predicted phosphodiesterase
MQLARAMRSDGRWRVVIFAGDITEKEKEERLNKVSSRVLNGKK